jgi:hypothetical protein
MTVGSSGSRSSGSATGVGRRRMAAGHAGKVGSVFMPGPSAAPRRRLRASVAFPILAEKPGRTIDPRRHRAPPCCRSRGGRRSIGDLKTHESARRAAFARQGGTPYTPPSAPGAPLAHRGSRPAHRSTVVKSAPCDVTTGRREGVPLVPRTASSTRPAAATYGTLERPGVRASRLPSVRAMPRFLELPAIGASVRPPRG